MKRKRRERVEQSKAQRRTDEERKRASRQPVRSVLMNSTENDDYGIEDT